jgi:hypothetical protein
MRPHEVPLIVSSQNTKSCLLKASIEVSDDLRTELNNTTYNNLCSEFLSPMSFPFVICMTRCNRMNPNFVIQSTRTPRTDTVTRKYSVFKATSYCEFNGSYLLKKLSPSLTSCRLCSHSGNSQQF